MLDDEMLTIDDLATFLKLKPQTIYKWAQSGKLPGAKFGKEWRFRKSAIERWIDSYIPSGPAKHVPGPAAVDGTDGSRAPTGAGTAEANGSRDGVEKAARKRSAGAKAKAKAKARGPDTN